MMQAMSDLNACCAGCGQGDPSCVSVQPGVRRRPGCDLGEARVWASLGGGWVCLYGGFGPHGLSVEWHDFECVQPLDWSRSFHPDSVEVCFNVSGHARLTRGQDSALLRGMTVGLYAAGQESLAAWRLPGERHEFLTLEFSRENLARRLEGYELQLSDAVRTVVFPDRTPSAGTVVRPMTSVQLKVLEALREPPVTGAAAGIWYEGRALSLMVELFAAAPGNVSGVQSRQMEVARCRVERVIRILAGRLAEPPSLEALGREVGCSPFHLSRTFSREMGMTIPQYLRQIRMERAAELLKGGRFNVTQAALEVGYSSLSHFSHAFRETMGCCPGLYPAGSATHRQ